jgi:hypothetical protein
MKCQNETVTVELKNGKLNLFVLLLSSYLPATGLPTRAVPQFYSFALFGLGKGQRALRAIFRVSTGAKPMNNSPNKT